MKIIYILEKKMSKEVMERAEIVKKLESKLKPGRFVHS